MAEARGARGGFDRFLGVSLGGGRGKTTAVARVEIVDGEVVLAEARTRAGHRGGGQSSGGSLGPHLRDDALLAHIREWVNDTTVVAVDTPMTLPPCLRCTLACPGVSECTVEVVAWMRRHAEALAPSRLKRDKRGLVTPYTLRATDMLVAAADLYPRETLGQGMGPLAARGVYFRRAAAPLLRLHENLIEMQPRATLTRMVGRDLERETRRGDTEAVWDARKFVLDRLAEGIVYRYVWPELAVRNLHVFDAVVAAFAAYRWAHECWEGPTDFAGRAEPSGESAVQTAARELADLWLEDGWVWTAPTAPPKSP